MKATNCKWLPNTVGLNDFGGNIPSYFEHLYNVFIHDLVQNQPVFKGERVGARKHPLINGKHEGYFHLTHRDYEKSGFENRVFDLERSKRLHWIKPTIENHECSDECCSHIKVWEEKKRSYILFSEERYVVILDHRKDYYVVVTAYYIEYDHSLRKLLNRYNKAKGAHNRTP